MTLKEIQTYLQSQAEDSVKVSIQKFVPQATRMYGVKMPILNALAVTIQEGGFVLAEQLWESGSFEERILAAKLLRRICKTDPHAALNLVEKFSTVIDNWALCDTLGMQSLKPVNKILQPQIFLLSEKLSTSDIMWQRRLSLVLLEDFCKQKNLHKTIQKRINEHKNDNAYYIKKAVEWLQASLNKRI